MLRSPVIGGRASQQFDFSQGVLPLEDCQGSGRSWSAFRIAWGAEDAICQVLSPNRSGIAVSKIMPYALAHVQSVRFTGLLSRFFSQEDVKPEVQLWKMDHMKCG
ncbi:hypothetical protein BT69DRAFT_1288250 [Atractiella rhizophila]|nr:hypothetical protein BT69DRAFT_1288250 [Atractiella rhizophila]